MIQCTKCSGPIDPDDGSAHYFNGEWIVGARPSMGMAPPSLPLALPAGQVAALASSNATLVAFPPLASSGPIHPLAMQQPQQTTRSLGATSSCPADMSPPGTTRFDDVQQRYQPLADASLDSFC